MRLFAALLVFMLASSSAFAFDPCVGSRGTAQHATADSINAQASVQAAAEGLAEGSAESALRVLALMRSPTPAMLAKAAADQAAADQKNRECEAAAAAARAAAH